jgi:hypothetical protein
MPPLVPQPAPAHDILAFLGIRVRLNPARPSLIFFVPEFAGMCIFCSI